ncbi:hypothetical protein [Sphingobacterium sp. HMA12]|uniref:hypothetical protein n=1 Tax=Sphingobacterium sp. HMA12 TaxID=2050894 RepID=UPI001315648A|nr:hypothetical protein [Sphingobacterium sp. HMA12]
MMFEIDLYNEEVLKAFYEKKNQEKLVHLQRASRGELMRAFLIRLENGEFDRDLSDLAKIFDFDGTVDNLKKVIKKAGADKFRPLQDFIQERTNKPMDNVIWLLALFIDFEPRPYDRWRELRQLANEENEESKVISIKGNNDHKHSVGESSITDIEESSEGTINKISDNRSQKQHLNNMNNDISEESGSQSSKNDIIETYESSKERPDILKDEPSKMVDLEFSNSAGTHKLPDVDKVSDQHENPIKKLSSSFLRVSKRKLLLGGSSIVTCIILAFLFPPSDKDCMCWNGIRYIQVDCQDKTQRYDVIGLNKEKLENFKRITKIDTLKEEDIGNIWYSKIDNEYEYFTGPGRHPVQRDRSLKALTKRIWNNQINVNAENKQYGIMQKQ